jgi:hypothetical protein
MKTYTNASSSVTGGAASHVCHYDIADGFDCLDFELLDAPVSIATGSTSFHSLYEGGAAFLAVNVLNFDRLSFGSRSH